MAAEPPSAPSRVGRTIAFTVFMTLSMLVGRGLFEGRAAMRRAVENDAKGDVEGAIAHAMRATKWYVPLAGHPREGYDLLRVIARRAESSGDVDTALIAWQAIRAGARATRSFFTPFEDRLLEADQQIAFLLASKPAPGLDRDKPREKLLEEHRQLLARDERPSAAATLSLWVGLAVWIFGGYRLGGAIPELSDVSEDVRQLARRRALAAVLIAAAGLGTYALALARA